MKATQVPRSAGDVKLLFSFYVLEGAGFILAIGLHKYWLRLEHLTVRQAALILAPLGVVLAVAGYALRRRRQIGARSFFFTLAMNLLIVAVMVITGELAVRTFSVSTPAGPAFARTLLLPRSWKHWQEKNADLVRQAPSHISYMVSDSLLGWTVAPSRRSDNGLYSSSVEGIRCEHPGMTYAGHPAQHRIAAIGDSYTFSLESPFEESWGYLLEQALGSEYVVLNFGVDAYGVDQAFLRYSRDARPLRPSVAIFGFIAHDLYRSMSVYSFMTFPEWNFPFAKPRFDVETGVLRLQNVPLISPAGVIATKSVAELPFIDYDPGYHPAEWRWHGYHSSYLARYLLSRFPSYPFPNQKASIETMRTINTELLLDFARQARAEGTVPLIVFFPSRSYFEKPDRTSDYIRADLQESGVHCIDMTPCILDVGMEEAFIPGRPHYSALGNAAVARCLLPVIRQATSE